MMRIALIALLVAQLPVAGQEVARTAENPLQDDPYWEFHLGAASRADAERTLSGSPTPTQAINAHFRLGSKRGAVRAAHALVTADLAELARGARLLRERSHDFNDDGTPARTELLALIARLKQHVDSQPVAPAEEAAFEVTLLENWVDPIDRDTPVRRLSEFAKKFPDSAWVAEQVIRDVDASHPRDDMAKFEAYRDLIRRLGDTALGARALLSFGFRLSEATLPTDDPAARLLELFDVIKRLESGRYPKGEWTERAPRLIHEFFFGSRGTIPPAAMPALYAAYLDFVRAHPDLRVETRVHDPIDWILQNGVSRLGSTGPERIAVVEKFLADLEGHFELARVRMLRARFYSALSNPEMLSSEQRDLIDPKEAQARAIRMLNVMIESGNPGAALRARGVLAGGALADGDYASARARYRALLDQSPDADWAWVAAMRLADITDALGQPAEAAAAYETIAEKYSSQRHVVMLARLAAADVSENLGRLAAAGAHYRDAVAAWPRVDEPIMIQMRQSDGAKPLPALSRYQYLGKDKIVSRLDRLSNATGMDGAALYQAQRALELDTPRDALKLLEGFQTQFPGSKNAAEAAALLRRARFAVVLADGVTDARRPAIDRELNSIATGKFDPVAAVARLAQAAMMVRRGRTREAEALTRTTLERWHAAQPAAPLQTSGIDRDVAAIRAALFLPRGGGVLGKERWNAFEWPAKTAPFIVVARDVLVKTADGREAPRPVVFPAPTGDRVLFLAPEDFRALNLILASIGGTETAEWVNATDLPNRPIGGAPQIAETWAKFFHVRPGHWGGWELTTYPDISRITFDRDNHALAEFTVGYSGGTIELEYENGVWVAKRLVNVWIT